MYVKREQGQIRKDEEKVEERKNVKSCLCEREKSRENGREVEKVSGNDKKRKEEKRTEGEREKERKENAWGSKIGK